MPVSNIEVRDFWEANPLAVAGIDAEPGTPAFYARFDRLREADGVEPYELSNRIHGYEDSAGKRVLDVGCGNGYVLSRYARHGAETVGIDLTEKALELSRRRFELDGLQGSFTRTDGDGIPFPDAHFDIACSMGVLHHIADPRPMLAEMRRVLKPGGRLILMLYHRHSWKYRVIMPLKLLFHPAYRGKSLVQALNMNDGPDCPLALVYDRAEAAALLGDFEDLRFELNCLSWKQLLLIPPLARLLSPLLPPCWRTVFARKLGWNLYIQATKPL